jgi:hypothetical protein
MYQLHTHKIQLLLCKMQGWNDFDEDSEQWQLTSLGQKYILTRVNTVLKK